MWMKEKDFAQEHHEYLIEQVQLVKKEYKPYIDFSLNRHKMFILGNTK